MPQLLILLLFLSSAFAGVHSALDFRSRSMPRANNLWGTLGYDGMLWGERSLERPLYGYYRLGAKAGGSPTYGGFLQVAPVAPLIFEVERSNTHRFTELSYVDCNDADCYGRIERTDFNVWLLGAYQRFVFVGNAMWRELKTQDEGRPVGLEIELFTVTPGKHQYFETSGLIGFKLPEDRIIGALSTFAHLPEDHRKAASHYAIYRFKYAEYGIILGAGVYESDQPNLDGFSAIFGIGRSWGERLGLL